MIEIGRYSLEWDGDRNWLLRATVKAEKAITVKGVEYPAGREVTQLVGYYSTLEAALLSMFNNGVNTTEMSTVSDVLTAIHEARDAIVAATLQIKLANIPEKRVR